MMISLIHLMKKVLHQRKRNREWTGNTRMTKMEKRRRKKKLNQGDSALIYYCFTVLYFYDVPCM